MFLAIACGVRPAACTRPTNGMTICPSLSTICSGREEPRAKEPELVDPKRTSLPEPPNKVAGGASQMAISNTSPWPTTDPMGCPSPNSSMKELRRAFATRPRATVSVTSISLIWELSTTWPRSARMLLAVGPDADMTAHPESAMARHAVPKTFFSVSVSFIIVQARSKPTQRAARWAKGADVWLNDQAGSRMADPKLCPQSKTNAKPSLAWSRRNAFHVRADTNAYLALVIISGSQIKRDDVRD